MMVFIISVENLAYFVNMQFIFCLAFLFFDSFIFLVTQSCLPSLL